ncbi:hypothetical protein ES703_86373 [subsurface metagenome]
MKSRRHKKKERSYLGHSITVSLLTFKAGFLTSSRPSPEKRRRQIKNDVQAICL